MTFPEALKVLDDTAQVLKSTRAKLEKYSDQGVVNNELASINYKVTQLAKHVTDEAASLVDTLDELDSRIALRKMIIEKLKEASNTLTLWAEYFEETTANTHANDTWEALLGTTDIVASHVSSCDAELTSEVDSEEA